MYLRCKDLPFNGKSLNYSTRKLEKGISVWECIMINNNIIPIIPEFTVEAVVDSSILTTYYDFPKFIVSGHLLSDKGSINEPLLSDVKIESKISLNILPINQKDAKDNNILYFASKYSINNFKDKLVAYEAILINGTLCPLLLSTKFEICEYLSAIAGTEIYAINGLVTDYDKLNRPIFRKFTTTKI